MKQNEIEKNTGPSAPASPAATTFTPYVTMYGNKPALVWRNEKGITSLVTADGQKVGSNKSFPVVRTLEVLDGRKSRYAITKMGYLDLSNGDFVDAKTAAAIDAFRNTYATKQTPVVTPAPVTPAPVAPVPFAPVPVAAVPVAWDYWKDVKDAPTRIFDSSLQEAITNSFDENTMAAMQKELSQAVLEAALCPSKEDLEEALQQLAKQARGLWSRVDAVTANYASSATPVAWFPLTENLEVHLDGVGDHLLWANMSEADPRAFKAGLFRVSLTKQRGLVVGIDRDRDGEIEIIAEMPLSIEENLGFVSDLVQKTFGYHPDQLTLF
jgi:hypothetical protein